MLTTAATGLLLRKTTCSWPASASRTRAESPILLASEMEISPPCPLAPSGLPSFVQVSVQYPTQRYLVRSSPADMSCALPDALVPRPGIDVRARRFAAHATFS